MVYFFISLQSRLVEEHLKRKGVGLIDVEVYRLTTNLIVTKKQEDL